MEGGSHDGLSVKNEHKHGGCNRGLATMAGQGQVGGDDSLTGGPRRERDRRSGTALTGENWNCRPGLGAMSRPFIAHRLISIHINQVGCLLSENHLKNNNTFPAQPLCCFI